MDAPNDNLLCKQAEDFYYNYVMDDGKEEIPAELIEHMDMCSDCKSSMAELQTQLAAIEQDIDTESQRNAVTLDNLELHYSYINMQVSCNAVKPFLPSLAGSVLAVRVPTPITAHIDNCKQCADDLKTISSFGLSHKQLCLLGQFFADSKASINLDNLDEIQGFNDKIHGILERKESNVVTIFKTDESIQGDSNLPISVEVLGKSKASLRFKPIFKQMAAAAAILLVAFFVSKVSVLQAVDLNQMYKALAKVKNVHIVKYGSEIAEPINETWTSKLLNMKMFKTSTGYTLWDINNKEIKTNEIATNSINIKKVDRQFIDQAQSAMNTAWDLLPFTSTADLPAGAVWEKVENENVTSGLSNIDVYDLSWTQDAISGDFSHYKWRIFVDTKTHLPQKLEFWEKYADQDKYELTTIKEIDYPTNSLLLRIIKQAGF